MCQYRKQIHTKFWEVIGDELQLEDPWATQSCGWRRLESITVTHALRSVHPGLPWWTWSPAPQAM